MFSAMVGHMLRKKVIRGVMMSERRKKRRIMDDVSHFTTLLGKKTRFIGTIKGTDNCIIYGYVEGDFESSGTLVLAEQGHWKGHIHAPNVIISGHHEGNITVSEKLELTSTAHINGHISSPVVAMEEGAIHMGEIRMGKKAGIVHFQEKRKSADDEKNDKEQINSAG